MTYDVVIIGAGPAGLSFARSLADTSLKIALVEKNSQATVANPAYDGRDIALTHLSLKILQRLGIWAHIPADAVSPIERAKVLDGTSDYALLFDSREEKFDALGYIVANNVIRQACYWAIKDLPTVDLITDTTVEHVFSDAQSASAVLTNGEILDCRLLVAADTRFSATRRKMGIGADLRDFARVAIVCQMEHEWSNDRTAFECFHYQRTLAVLPLAANRSSIVITAPTDKADEILYLSEADFNRDVQRRFANRLGKMTLITPRYHYPLVGVHAKQFIATRFALIGDAAVGMHPVTAHGFNLGLSGQDILSREIKAALNQGRDIGKARVLYAYQNQHMRVTKPLYLGTNTLVSLFTNDSLPVKALRKAVLHFSNHFEPIKWLIKKKLTDDSPKIHLPLVS